MRCGYLACPMCGLIVYQCVKLFPCAHQFCGGCVAGWTHDKFTCPYCFERVLSARRNLIADELIEEYLRAHPEDRRTGADLADLNRRNWYSTEGAIMAQRSEGTSERRPEVKQLPPAPPDPRQSCFWQGAPKCIQCPRNIDGYRCVREQEHVECYLCKQLMPARKGYPQQCFICQFHFCNAYFRNIKHCESGVHMMEWYVKTAYLQVPPDALYENEYEQSLLKDSMRQIGLSLQMLSTKLIEDMEKSRLSFTVDGKPNIRVTRHTYVCNFCAHSLWKEMLMFHRIRINDTLEENIKSRVKCKNGIQCRNQKTIYAHSFKFNHLVCKAPWATAGGYMVI